MLFVLEYRPPISSSVSNENTLKCRVQFFFFLAATGSFSMEPSVISLLFLLRLMQKNINAIAASTTTTTGTATAACIPGDDMVLASACKSFDALLAALDAVDPVEELVALDPEAVAGLVTDGDVADPDCCVEAALEADAALEGVALALPDVIVLKVVDCRVVSEAAVFETFATSDAFNDDAAAAADDCSGDEAVKGSPPPSVLKLCAIEAKLLVSTLSVNVKGELPEKLWGFGEDDMLDYVRQADTQGLSGRRGEARPERLGPLCGHEVYE